MKKILFVLLLFVTISFVVKAQDDVESIVSGDVEVEGLDNFWVESRLIFEIDDAVGFKLARPKGGNVAFLIHVQKYMSKVFNVLLEKYPEKMLSLIGTRTEMIIEFEVTSDNEIQLISITNGALFGFDVAITEKLFNTYKKWHAAQYNNKQVDSRVKLLIDVSL